MIPGILESIKTRILVVEDHGDTRRILMSMLSRWGYEVSAADSVASGLEFIRAKDFDVVLSDIGLPDGDGYDLVSAAKQIQKFKAVALSAYGSTEDVLRGRAAGFDHHLTKPVDFHELRSVLSGAAV